jgi:hypothetical protein
MSEFNEYELLPIQYFIKKIHELSVDSVLSELPFFHEVITPDTTGQEVAEILEKDPHLPGLLVMHNGILDGLIGREMFYERVGRKFGVEKYFSRPISLMMEMIGHEALILPDSMLITTATNKALSRDLETLFQPIIIENPHKEYRLLSAMLLFLAQSQQLLEIHKQRYFTVDSGIPLTDQEAIVEFVKHVGNQSVFTPEMFLDRHEIRCDHCTEMVVYSMVDIIRCFPQLNRGVVVEEKMGVRTYRVYVRHYCREREIWEIPMQLDERLEYRSQRQARAVESYA